MATTDYTNMATFNALNVGCTEKWLLLVKELVNRWSQASDGGKTDMWIGAILILSFQLDN
jgi:hypothetical protein